MKKHISIISAVVILFATSCGRTVNPGKTLKTGMDSFSYTIGLNLGKGMKQQGLEKLDYSSLIKGIEDALKKDSGFAVGTADLERVQRGFIMKEQGKKVKKFQDESKKWMVENSKKAGVSALASGGQFKLIKAGSGASPQAYDTIEYSIVMKNSKGKEMRNSSKMGGNPKHSLKQIGLAPLEEAFQKVAPGAEFEVYLQNDLVPELGGMAESFEDKYGVTLFTFQLIKVIPGKPEATKPAGTPSAPEMPKMP